MHMGGYHEYRGGCSARTEHPPRYCIHIIQGENLTKSKEIVKYFPFLKSFSFFETGAHQFINLNEIFDGQEQQSNSNIALIRKYNTHSSQAEIVIALSG